MSTDVIESLPTSIKNILGVHEVIRDERRGCVKIILEPNPEVLTIHGEPHGGYISLITIISAEIAATNLLHEEEFLVVINHNVNFLRHVEAYEQELEIDSCVLSRGERIIYIETYVRCRGEDIAQAITSFTAEKHG